MSIFFNDLRCGDHCEGASEEPAAPAPAPAADGDVIIIESPAAGSYVNGEPSGARNDPIIILDNGAVLTPADDSSSVSSMPSLESVNPEFANPDFTNASTSDRQHPVREITTNDITRSVRHLVATGVVDETTSPAVVHGMAEADNFMTPRIPEDVSMERRLAAITIERNVLLVEISALEMRSAETRRLWEAAREHFRNLVTEFDSCVREQFSAYVEDVNDAADFTRRNRFSYHNMALRQGNAPDQRRVFEASMNIARGFISGRHDGSVDFNVYGSHADGAINRSIATPQHRYTQQAPATREGEVSGAGETSSVNHRGVTTSGNPFRRIEGNIEGSIGGYAYWPRFDWRDYPSYPHITVNYDRHASDSDHEDREQILQRIGQGQVRQRERGGRGNPRGRYQGRGQSSVPLVYPGNPNPGRLHDHRGSRGGQVGRQRSSANTNGRQRGRPYSQPAVERRQGNDRVEDATRMIDRTRNAISRTRRAFNASMPMMGSSRNASRVNFTLGGSTTPHVVAGGETEIEILPGNEVNPTVADAAPDADADSDADAASEALINEFLGMMIDSE